MKSKQIFALLFLLLAAIGCGKQINEVPEQILPPSESYESKGDSMLYGFACDGCSDSVLVFMPDTISDPISYNIINATLQRHVFGSPKVGDKVAIQLSPDGKEVLMVVDIDDLKGTWTYMVLPESRMKPVEVDSEIKVTPEEQHEIDSFIATLMVPREYGMTLKRDFTVQSVGGPPRQTSLDEESPVVYPRQRRYHEWHLWNGKLILTNRGRHALNDSTHPAHLVNDTAEFLMMYRDTLMLKFKDFERGYSRKPDSLSIK